MKLFTLCFLVFFSTTTFASVDTPVNLTSQVFYYLDDTSKLTQNTIKTKDAEFKIVNKGKVSFGHQPDATLWVKFTLHNAETTKQDYMLEYVGNNIYEAKLYDFKHKTIDIIGASKLNKFKKNHGNAFQLSIAPNSSIDYYMKVQNHVSSMKLELLLWKENAYYVAKNDHFTTLFFLNIAMGILLVYNLMIFFFTRDRAYIYYALVTLSSLVFSTLYHEFMTSGYIFFYPSLLDLYDAKITQWAVLVLFVFSPWFARSILQVKVFMPKEDKYFIYMPIGLVLLTVLSVYDFIPSLITLVYLILMILSIVFISFIALNHGMKQARYFIFAWLVFLSAFVTIVLEHYEIVEVDTNSIYLVQVALLIKAFLLSIGLSARVHYEKEKKELSDAKLIEYKNEETTRLEHEVSQRTLELEKALSLKELLLKEVHHRVKNNMQVIISLLRLQADNLDDEKLHQAMEVSEQRIKAMVSVHEMLYMEDNIGEVDASKYFYHLAQEVKSAYDIHNNIEVSIDTDVVLNLDHAIYVGLIINELLTNAFKYAFDEEGGKVSISLSLSNGNYTLVVSDNGKGGEVSISDGSLGMMLVNTLIKVQLKGSIETRSENGVTHTLRFSR